MKNDKVVFDANAKLNDDQKRQLQRLYDMEETRRILEIIRGRFEGKNECG